MLSDQGCKTVPGAKNLQLLIWLGNSPDLILIEKLLNLMKAKIAEKYLSNLDELQQVIKKVSVKDFFPEYCYNRISTVPCRVQALTKNNNGHIKY